MTQNLANVAKLHDDEAREVTSNDATHSVSPAVSPAAEPKQSRRRAASTGAKVADSAKAARPSSASSRTEGSKADVVLKRLRLARGVTVAQITEVTGWQSHSVRGFLSAVVRKKLGLNLVSEVGKDGQRRYRVADDAAKAS